MSGVGSVTAAVAPGLLLQGDQNIGTTASLLKKATQADQNLVAKLLPATPAGNGSLDVRA